MLSNEQDPTKRRRLLKQKEYWELEMDEAFEDIKKEKKKKKKKKIAVDPSSRALKRVISLQESDSDADQVSNSKKWKKKNKNKKKKMKVKFVSKKHLSRDDFD
eukprot:g47833.t1